MFEKILLLDSNKASNNTYKLDNRIKGSYKLVSFVATNNMYNINDNNNKIYMTIAGFPHTPSLTNGFYDTTNLKSHISSVLNDLGAGTFTITLDDTANKFTITNTNNFYFTFGTNTTNSARKLLGFNESDGTNALSQVSDNPIDLNTHKNIFITFNEDDNRNIEGLTFFNASLLINGMGAYGEVCRYINDDNFDQYVKFKDTKSLTIKFHDTSNNSINLNSDYQIILQKKH